MSAINYQIHEDGSFDISGSGCRIREAYPSVNGRAFRADSVEIRDHSVLYHQGQAYLRLEFVSENDRLCIRTFALGLAGAHDISPIGEALLVDASACFIQGPGMEGPSGYRRLSETETAPESSKTPLHSSGLIALLGESSEEPQTQSLALFLYAEDHRHFSTQFSVERKTSLFGVTETWFTAGFNLEGTAKQEQELPALFVEEQDDLTGGLKKVAEKIAVFMHARHRQPPAFHWCSWYYLYQNFSQEYLEEYLEGMKETGCTDFRYIQIDAGYEPSPGDWLMPNHRFPEGLEKAAQTITNAGFGAGIWIAPFMVGDHSAVYENHPDWILRKKDGSPVTELRSYNEPKTWGNVDGNYYVLDTSHPEAFDYLRHVFRTLRGWGFTLFKTDFMFWNMQDSSAVSRYDKTRTSVEILRDTLQMIREEIGEDSYLLGCIAPFMPFIGYADGMRIAGDVGASWSEVFGPLNMIRELQADHYFNHVFWQNDPDSILLRDFDIFLKPVEIRSLALLQAISGGVVTTSDPMHRISEERRDLLRFLKPREKANAEFPFLTQERDDLVILHHGKKGNLLYALNLSEKERTFVYDYRQLFSEGNWCSWRYENKENRNASDYCIITLQPHESALLFLTKNPLPKAPENLWDLQ